ncbi:hypothetical protein CL653_01430 [bacterium]|nr:hypothetical protein [bacterium]|tara:strand:- start:143 stop:379 length:237 start_codon:yes stop_codon:yes gene_type:complete
MKKITYKLKEGMLPADAAKSLGLSYPKPSTDSAFKGRSLFLGLREIGAFKSNFSKFWLWDTGKHPDLHERARSISKLG